MHHTEGCILCGKELLYSNDSFQVKCSICGRVSESNVKCPDGHMVCDACHQSSAYDVIELYCNQCPDTDPGVIARQLMGHPSFHIHGPEHHFLVPAVLISAYYNFQQQIELKTTKLKIARKRASSVLGGFCGTHGNCGAAVGTGIFASIITENTPLSDEEWKLSNKLTAMSLLRIADAGGPRCCKRDSFLALEVAIGFLKTYFDVALPLEKIDCDFSEQNRQCKKSACKYYSRPA